MADTAADTTTDTTTEPPAGTAELDGCIEQLRACQTDKNTRGAIHVLASSLRDMVMACGDHEAEGFDDCLGACEDAQSACADHFPETEDRSMRKLPTRKSYALDFTGEVVDGGLVVFATSAAVPGGDILDIKTLNLDRLRTNPVVLWNHDTYEPPIGTFDPDSLRIEDFETYTRALFRPMLHKETARAADVANLWDKGLLRTVSIGFLIDWKQSVWRCDLPKEHPAYGPQGFYYVGAKAYEISVVTVPMDDKAIKIGRSGGAGMSMRVDVKRLAAEIAPLVVDDLIKRGTVTTTPKPNPPASDDWFRNADTKGDWFE